MENQKEKNKDFINLYNKSYRLAAAVFAVANVMDDREELKIKIKKLSLEIVSFSVQLKDTTFFDAKKIVNEIEKDSLELMSMLDISAIAGMISRMNTQIIKEEFESFIHELSLFTLGLDESKNIGVEALLKKSDEKKNPLAISEKQKELMLETQKIYPVQNKTSFGIIKENNNEQSRKITRKTSIYEFIKRQNNVTIKDIVPHIVGCSEKTIQRELVDLINEGKITKSGERRWTRYSVI